MKKLVPAFLLFWLCLPALAQALYEKDVMDSATGDLVATFLGHGSLMLEFNKQVNAAIVDPQFIARVRKKLALDQREAAEIFGGGVNAFSRYQTGKTKPPLALVKLLKLLDRPPDLLAEVRLA